MLSLAALHNLYFDKVSLIFCYVSLSLSLSLSRSLSLSLRLAPPLSFNWASIKVSTTTGDPLHISLEEV